jgi:4-amino-4-deoxy-L-arabinose transferase-like glycosyltransferase
MDAATVTVVPAAAQRHRWWPLAVLALVHVLACIHWRGELAWDASNGYLPFARQLLDEGWTFFRREESMWYPPGAYLIPALFAANASVVSLVYLALSVATLFLLYGAATRAHSPRAGLLAAALYALSPSVAPLVINVLTEPPFLFFCALWLWGLARAFASPGKRWLLVAGLAMGAAVCVRAAPLPYLAASLAVSLVLLALRIGPRETLARFGAVQAVALVIPALVIVKNWILFSYPQLATGGGNALYLGVHTLTGGYDPVYGGLTFDVGAIVNDVPLRIRSDRMLHAAGLYMLQEQPLATLLANFAQKAGALWFHPDVVLRDAWLNARSVRIGLAFAALPAALRWREPLVAIAGSMLLYLTLVHLPLLFVDRYSVGVVDLWLAFLAAVGLATLARWRLRGRLALLALFACAVVAGKTLRHIDDRVAPLRFDGSQPHRIVWSQERLDHAVVKGAEVRDGRRLEAWSDRVTVELALPPAPEVLDNRSRITHNLFLVVELENGATSAYCGKGRIAFRSPENEADPGRIVPYYPFRLAPGSGIMLRSFGITEPTPTWPHPVASEGVLTLELSCEPGAAIVFRKLAVAEAAYGAAYGERVQRR